MKQVYKCDHCTETNESSEVIIEHEKTCSFNKELKNCWSCAFYDEYHGYPSCGKGQDAFKYLNEINCKEWHDDDKF